MRLLYPSSSVAVLALAGVLLLSAGCARRDKAVVKGQVKFFDKTLTTGTVGFTNKDGTRVGSGNIDFEGHYTVSDAPVGPCTVTVRVPHVPSMPLGQKMMAPKPPPGLPPMRAPGGEGGDDSGTSQIDPRKIVEIPSKYANPDSSGLTYTVQPGENTFDITLTP